MICKKKILSLYQVFAELISIKKLLRTLNSKETATPKRLRVYFKTYRSMEEIWRDIPEYTGIYQASNLGRIKSIINNKEHIKKFSTDSSGYFIIRAFKNKKGVTKRVHKLIAMAFLNHNPDGYNEVVDHINNNKKDNRSTNLQLVSQRYNSSKDKINKSSKFTGVTYRYKRFKWESSIKINGKSHFLGMFNSEEEAHLAYQNKLKTIEQ